MPEGWYEWCDFFFVYILIYCGQKIIPGILKSEYSESNKIKYIQRIDL